ncbi:MAG: methionine adenosyltransferase domain-containing protein, partial [bacterium]
TGVMPDDEIEKLVRKHFDLTPKGIIERLQLRRPIYRKTAVYGHFGRSEPTFSWENTDVVEELAG